MSQQPGAAWRLSRSLNVSLTLAAITLDPVPFHPNPILKGAQAAVDGQPPGDQMMLGACGETPPFSENQNETGKSQLASNPLEADKDAWEEILEPEPREVCWPLSICLPRLHTQMFSTGSFIREPPTIEVQYYKVRKLRHPPFKMRARVAVLCHLQTLMFRSSPFPAA